MSFSWVTFLRYLAIAGLGILSVGCASGGRLVSISTQPADAMLLIDDVDTVRAPSDQRFLFSDPNATHKVLASRFGYTDQERVIKEDPATGRLLASYKDAQ